MKYFGHVEFQKVIEHFGQNVLVLFVKKYELVHHRTQLKTDACGRASVDLPLILEPD